MRLRTTAIRPSVLCGLVLCLCWVAASAQDDYPQTEQKLIITLWKVKREAPNEVTSVLEKNREMVNADLWLQLVDLAAQKYYENPSDAFAFYDIAKQVAVLINSNELLGRTLYDVARSYSGLGGYEKARSAYLESYKAFVAAGLNRDAR